ncbi:MAG: amidase [Pararhodobacter sp.]|nr:amidase [Pararhodobacter sp.]
MNEPHFQGLVEIARRIAAREITAREVTEHQLDRIATHADLGAFVALRAEAALAEAARADTEIAAGQHRGPLHGVPVALKDVIDLAGMATTAGMAMRAGAIAERDATVTSRLRAAGAVILGKLNLTEGAFGDHRPPFGTPVNPWDARFWPGASSSGNGVATAAGLCFGSIGTDTGGSIRMPAAANGVAGLKPTRGRISRHGVFPLARTLDHLGPMARRVEDLAAILAAVAGPDPEDPTCAHLPPGDLLAATASGVQGLRLGVDPGLVGTAVDPEISAAVMEAMRLLCASGAERHEVRFPDIRNVVDLWFDICAVDAAQVHAGTWPGRRASYGPALSACLEHASTLSAQDYHAAILRREDLAGWIEALFSEVDVLVMPVFARLVPAAARADKMDATMIEELHRFTCPFTLSGHPCAVVRAGTDRNGMPIAIQFVAARFKEAHCLRAASAFEGQTPWHELRPPCPSGKQGAKV